MIRVVARWVSRHVCFSSCRALLRQTSNGSCHQALAEREADDALFLLRSGELPWCFSATSEQAGHPHERPSSDCLLVLPALRPAAGAVVMLEGLLLGSSARATLRALEAVGFMHDGRSRPVDAPMAELPLSPATGPLASRADTSMKKWNAILRQV